MNHPESRIHPSAHDRTDLGDHPEDVTHAAVDVTGYRRAPHDSAVRAAPVHAERATPCAKSRDGAAAPRGLPA
jgi:hypothetical protein